MDKTIYQAHSCDALCTTTRAAQCDLQMFEPTIKQETVECMDEKETHHNDCMYPYKPLGSPNCVDYYDIRFCVAEELKKEFPGGECSQPSTSVPCINECSVDSKIDFENDELSKVLETQEIKQEVREEAFSFIETEEIHDKKDLLIATTAVPEEYQILVNGGNINVHYKVQATLDIQPKRLNLLKHSDEHLQVEPPTAVGNERNVLSKCECCNEYFNNYNSNENLKSQKCEFCEDIIKSKSALVQDTKSVHYDSGKISGHKYRQHGPKVENTNNAALERDFQCDLCKKKFQRNINLIRHIQSIHYDYNKRFECWCGKQFRKPSHLYNHKYRQHGPKVVKTNNAALEKDFQCDLCKKIFQRKSNLRRHIRSIHYDHGKRFECWCGKQFRKPSHLYNHKYRQHGPKVVTTNNAALIKEFQCDICKKIFKHKDILKIHLTNIHYDYGKRFKCWCGKQFRTPIYLSNHKYQQHGSKVKNTNNATLHKEFQCDICKKIFKTKGILKTHITSMHYDYGKTFKCSCGKQFRTPIHLSDHKYRQHGPKVTNTNNATLHKEFQCDICKKIFKTKGILKTHITSMHYDYGKTFKCSCGKQFHTPIHLSDHKYRQHGSKVEHTNNATLI